MKSDETKRQIHNLLLMGPRVHLELHVDWDKTRRSVAWGVLHPVTRGAMWSLDEIFEMQGFAHL